MNRTTAPTKGHTMTSPTPTAFGTQLLGQTENALNAILARQLAGTGLTEPQWVTLSIPLAGALKLPDDQARSRITELAAADLVDLPKAAGSPVTLSAAGQSLHREIRT